ncbi:GAF domain-containing protein [Marinomonas piezotolerans]|uniref:GAF domain-containing protein n=1 Tax=Marinomonas piezotolerans TaxID=2213058 RepID=A0A370U5Z5_9GAMM|nr:GAF domain-containing protein [Marinomonas piezotolerans]RDL43202.1 GAF domain-containing protein [Marinomonas piezotolerans]
MFTIDIDETLSARDFYFELNNQLDALLSGERDLICNAAQFSAFIMQTLPNLNWAGLYFVRQEELVLGPYVGKVACTRIPFSKGVCGAAARSGKIQKINDVHIIEDHIACDAASNAELVLPIIVDGKIKAVFDIDSPLKNRFSDEDQHGIAMLVETFTSSSDWNWQIL